MSVTITHDCTQRAIHGRAGRADYSDLPVDDSDRQALAEIRRQLIDRLPELGGLDGHILLAIRFHRLVRLTKARKKDSDGATWVAFFQAHVPHLADHAWTLWKDWRTALLKDDSPGPGVVISEHSKEPHPHGQIIEAGKVFIDLESAVDDCMAAVDSLLKACADDAELCATVIRNWRATQWGVWTFQWEAGPPAAGTALGVLHVLSASASASIASASPDPDA
jgi:hypothetical protein